MYASTLCVNASMPVPAVRCGGRSRVSSGSAMASTGIKCGLKTTVLRLVAVMVMTVERDPWLTIAAAAVVVIAVVAVLAGRPQGGHHDPRPAAGASRPPALSATRNYPAAITARIGVRNVISMAGAGDAVWAMTLSGELVRISARTNAVTLSVHIPGIAIGGQLAAGGGRLWLDACRSSGRVQLLGIDPASGHIRSRITVPGSCGSIAYGLGHLWIVSGVKGGIRILRIRPG